MEKNNFKFIVTKQKGGTNMLKYLEGFFHHLRCRFSRKICTCFADTGHIGIINSVTKV